MSCMNFREVKLTGVGIFVADLISAEGAIDDWCQALVEVCCIVQQILVLLALKVLIRADRRLGAIARSLQPCRVFTARAGGHLLDGDQLVSVQRCLDYGAISQLVRAQSRTDWWIQSLQKALC